MKRRRPLPIRLALSALVAIHLLCLLTDLVAPYGQGEMNRRSGYAPPTRVRFVDAAGEFHLRPFVYARRPVPGGGAGYVEERSRRYPVRFFVPAETRRLAGLIPVSWRLFGVEEAAGIHLLGTDGLGRDQFSRLLYGGRLSLFAGLLAGLLAVGLGFVLGAAAGYRGGWADEAIMRSSELFITLPWLYLLFGVRAFLPLDLGPAETFAVFAALIGVVGWAQPARMIRGVCVSAREREFVSAARALGASDLHLLTRHVLPQAIGVAQTLLTVLIPRFILAEVTLSYLGLGAGEPAASWGTMLRELQTYGAFVSYRWLVAPAVALVLVVLAYQRLGGAVQERFGGTEV